MLSESSQYQLHIRYLAGAGGAVVVGELSAVLIDLTVEQAAPQRQIEHLPLTWRRRRDRVRYKKQRETLILSYLVTLIGYSACFG